MAHLALATPGISAAIQSGARAQRIAGGIDAGHHASEASAKGSDGQ
jgi:hypothetical protein